VRSWFVRQRSAPGRRKNPDSRLHGHGIRFGIPLRLIQQALDAARMPFASLFRQLPPTLASGAAEQSHYIAPASSAGFAAPETRGYAAIGAFYRSAEVTRGTMVCLTDQEPR
jgi:hypothetical protein